MSTSTTAEARNIYAREWTYRNPERRRSIARACYARHRDRMREERRAAREADMERATIMEKARVAVSLALTEGILKRGVCEVCGRETVHGHHDDYSKPLQVRWLCPSHHALIHHRGEYK